MKNLKNSLLIALWFMFLTFPMMVIKVNTLDNIVEWRWVNLAYVGLGAFALSFLWRYLLKRKRTLTKMAEQGQVDPLQKTMAARLLEDPKLYRPAMALGLALCVIFPLVFSTYQTNILISALIYVVLGLGLNITVGLAGLLDLGYVAFFAVGAYSYPLLYEHFGITFWLALPIGAAIGALFGLVLGFPILRLRGDYLAIVTLGFGSIVKIVLENWGDFTHGPSGIANIPRPGFFGMEMNLSQATTYVYYIMIVLVLITILVTNRLKDSRIGRAWIALREDEIACVAMGIDMAKTKLSAYALGAAWAGLVGVIFAAKTTFINPASFTFMESAIILSIVVLGGMGSIFGVILGAFILILLPEYLRAFSEYRMLVFGLTMVLMMIFRPQGIISDIRRKYEYRGLKKQAATE
ncbi:MAG: high-affinity branched-chain amino acid ABC transporter permease LivM [Trichloromonadaceae bacterium]